MITLRTPGRRAILLVEELAMHSDMEARGWKLYLIGLVLLGSFLCVSTVEAATATDVVKTLEEKVMEIAVQAGKNFNNTCDLVSTCQGPSNCSRLECHPTHEDNECVYLTDSRFCPYDDFIQIDTGRSSLRIPPFATLDGINEQINNLQGYTVCAQRELDGKFKEIYKNNTDTSYFLSLHFGSVDGTFFLYPGREIFPQYCGTYDPRLRNWYIGATSVLVDVIVLFDTGGYMNSSNFNRGTALESAISIITNLSQTIPQTSSGLLAQAASRLTIIPFNESGINAPNASYFQYNVTTTGPIDAIRLRDQLRELYVNPSETKQSNFTAAFSGALSVFGSSDAHALQVVILLTDLDVTDKASPSAQENQSAFDLWGNRQPAGARMFIFDFGRKYSSNWSTLACQVNGSYEQLNNVDGTMDALLSIKSYFNFLSSSRMLAKSSNPLSFWLPLYDDASGLGDLITVSFPAMSADGQLIGVAGIDFKVIGSDQSLSTQINDLLRSDEKLNETLLATYPAGASIDCKGSGNGIPSCPNTPKNYEPLCATREVSNNKTLVGLLCGCPNPQKSPVWVILVSAIGGSAALVVILFPAIICFIVRRRRRRQKPSTMHKVLSLTEYSYEELRRGTIDFDMANVIGTGMFGVVYKGVVRNANVAVKKLNKPADCARDFQAEIMALGITRHPNLVELQGYCFQPTECFLVYELVKSGDLESWLFPAKQGTGEMPVITDNQRFLSWGQRRKIARGIARALNYLHLDLLPAGQIFHLDIKPRNILLEEDFNPKISDFGISQIYAHGYTLEMLTCRYFTPGYVAPEVLNGIKPDSKLDVFSFGMVLLQLMSGRQLKDPETGEILIEWARRQTRKDRVARVVDERMVAIEMKEFKKAVVENSKQMIILALRCLSIVPHERPEMKEVEEVLDKLHPMPVKKDFHDPESEESDPYISEKSSDRLFVRGNSQSSNEVLSTERRERFPSLRSQTSYWRPPWDEVQQEQAKDMSGHPYYDRSDDSSSPDQSTAFETPPQSPIHQMRRPRPKKSRKSTRVRF